MQVLKEEIRNSILQAAFDIFSSVGFKVATMNQIAERAGVAKSNLYRYYQSKNEIFRAVADMAMEDIRQSIMGSLTDCFYLPNDEGNSIRKQLNVNPNNDRRVEFRQDPPTFYIRRIFPILYSKRKQMLLFVKMNDSLGRREYVAEITEILDSLFSLSQNLDMPDGFSRVISNSLISNICFIFNEYETEEDLFAQFCAIINYHSYGISHFSKNENKKKEKNNEEEK